MTLGLNELIVAKKEQFKKLDKANGNILAWEQECLFARQQITKNDYSIETAQKNPSSLQAAILNVAAIGISLNPALAHAYLVPRGGHICLDISYRGLVKLATDCGAIQWAKSELVYSQDEFTWKGVNTAPEHKADVFSDRGEIVGGYCLALLPDGSPMVEIMKIDEMNKIQATSKAASGPWKTWPDEMRKKSITKRASKSWPQTKNRVRLDRAVETLNEHEGMVYSIEEQSKFQSIIDKGDPLDFLNHISGMDDEKKEALYKSFEYGKKTSGRNACRELKNKAMNILEEWTIPLKEAIDDDRGMAVIEILEGLSDEVQGFLVARLTGEQQDKLEILKQEETTAAAE